MPGRYRAQCRRTCVACAALLDDSSTVNAPRTAKSEGCDDRRAPAKRHAPSLPRAWPKLVNILNNRAGLLWEEDERRMNAGEIMPRLLL